MAWKSEVIVILLLCLCRGMPAEAAAEKTDAGPDKSAATAKEEKEYPEFKEVTEGMKEMPGLFTLWHYPGEVRDKSKDREKLLCQVPASFLGQMFMLSTSFSGGGMYTGFPLNERAVKWEEFNRRLLLIEPQTGYVIDEKSTVGDVVRRTYPDRILAAVPIVTKTPGGDPVIDLGPLLKSEFADIAWTANDGRTGSIDSSLSRWAKKKAFPENVEICVELAVRSANPPGSFQKKLVHYSFWNLRKTDYKPRVGDDRVGYFLTANQDWSKPTGGRDIFNRYIDRWNLQKRDPTLEICEPVKPIVFYIEKTVPVRFRRAIQDGILEWNKAYDKVGFSNAVQVRQQTDDNEWKDLDPEDMRYSFFRWIVTGAGFAMGPHRANPFTGEIYDADIIFDDSMVRYYEQDLDLLTPSAVAARKMDLPMLRTLLGDFATWNRPSHELHEFDESEAASRDVLRNRMFERRRFYCCDYMEGMRHQMALAGTVLAGQPKEVVEKFLYDVIKETACHEVGHTLGLRHNFAGSFIYSLEEIKKRRTTDEPTTGSIMDYNPVLFFKENTFAGRFITPTIGPYDYWAIEYGYRPYDEAYMKKQRESKEPKEAKESKDKPAQTDAYVASLSGEQRMLEEIARRSTEPELLYATDEDTMAILSPDPRSNRFDLSSDPFEYAQGQFDLVNDRLAKILEWGSKEGESWYHTRAAFIRLLLEKVVVLDYVGRYAGGQYFSRSHRSDPNALCPFRLVDPKLQRKALTFVEDSLFKDDFFAFPPELLNHLAPPRWWHAGTSFNMSYVMIDFPTYEYIGALQWWHLVDRLSPYTLMRIYNAEPKTTDPEKLTVAEYLQRIQDACWKETLDPERNKSWTPAKPFVSEVRRSLQREYLGIIEPLVRTRPGTTLPPDLHAMLWCSIEDLGTAIDETLKKPSLDFASRAHLRTCKSRVDRMLNVELPEMAVRQTSL